MNLVETFLAADRTITTTIAALPPGAGTAVVEPVFATGTAGDGSVRAALAHLARDEAWVPSQLAGETMAGAGADRFDGDLLGDDLAAAVLGGLAPRAELWWAVGILLPAREPAPSSARDRLLALAGVISDGR